MEDEGEEPFVALDSLLEVNLVEDATGCAQTHTEGDSFKNWGQESSKPAYDPVNNSYAKNTMMSGSIPYSDLDAVQTAWGMDLEEDMFYKDLFKDVSTVQYLRLHCTVCDTHLGCKQGSVLMRHVRLGTLLCKDCFKFYGTGQFPIAEDGSESFCYWCGQGGNVICCSSCSAVFCKKCIRLNFAKSTIKEIESSNEWLCFVCNFRSLWEHRAVCRAAITYESSGPGPLKGDEAENETPGHNQEFCCASGLHQRHIPRLKSNMPSVVTFGEYIKSGRVKTSVMKMLKNVPVTGNVNDCISLDSDEALKSEKIISADTQNTTLTHKATSKEMVSSEQSVPASHTNNVRARVSVASHNISYVDIGPLISQARFPSIHSQPTTGRPFLNQGIRSNIISNSQIVPSGRVVLMPPVHIPHRTSVLRLPQAGATVIQHNSPVDALSLGALLSSSPPVGSIQQRPNPVFRFQNGTSPFVVVSESNRVPGVPVVVRNSSGAYVPMYVNNSDNLHYIPKETSQVGGISPYVQNQGINAISHPTQKQEKSENSITFPHSNVSNNAATYQPSINCDTSQNMSETSLLHTVKSNINSIVNTKSKTKSGYIQVRSPTALQSIKVTDIEHSPLVVSETVPCAVPEQQSIHNSSFAGCPSETLPSTSTPLAKEQSMCNSLLTGSTLKKCPQNKAATSVTSSTADVETTGVLKNLLSGVTNCSSATKNISDTVGDSSSPLNDVFSRKEIPQAHVVDQTSQELSSRSTDVVETRWFKENLLEAENVAKYMLTRITCVQEELDSKSHQKKTYDDMVNHFSKLLEITSKKLADVSRNFTANFQRWKALSPSCHTGFSQESCANSDKNSNVETMNSHSNSVVDNSSSEEVEIISVKVRGKKRSRTSSNSGSQISPQVTCTTDLGSAITLDAASSAVCTDSSEATTKVATPKHIGTDSSEATSKVATPKHIAHQPTRMFTRQSNSCRTNTKAMKCCISPDQQLRNKHKDFQHNMKSSRRKSKKLFEQEEEVLHIPEKRMKFKEVRIVLERIKNPAKMVFKGELNDDDVVDHNTNDSNAESLEDVAMAKVESYLGSDALLKQIKPCSVVIPRLSQKDKNHCI